MVHHRHHHRISSTRSAEWWWREEEHGGDGDGIDRIYKICRTTLIDGFRKKPVVMSIQICRWNFTLEVKMRQNFPIRKGLEKQLLREFFSVEPSLLLVFNKICDVEP
ncbi:hypothetical protein L6452_19561 [Arctium lappa]|uniref:Uncharacterized protein n=1 Tax=Arctium lappa TaxID=4217 RepID=A0ACB9BA77_ARCLA|nr:hypothetical protein L6452_19561 [Arctium lappa]